MFEAFGDIKSAKVVQGMNRSGISAYGHIKERYVVLFYDTADSALDAQAFSGNKLKDGVVTVLTPGAASGLLSF